MKTKPKPKWTVDQVRIMLNAMSVHRAPLVERYCDSGNIFRLSFGYGVALTYALMKEISEVLQTDKIDVETATEHGYYDSIEVHLSLLVVMS